MTDQTPVTPSHRHRVNKEPIQVQYRLMDAETKKDLNRIAASKAGQRFLRWMMDHLGYKYSSLTMTPEGTLLIDAIVHNEAKRSVWLNLRKNVQPEYLNIIESEVVNDNRSQQPKQPD